MRPLPVERLLVAAEAAGAACTNARYYYHVATNRWPISLKTPLTGSASQTQKQQLNGTNHFAPTTMLLIDPLSIIEAIQSVSNKLSQNGSTLDFASMFTFGT